MRQLGNAALGALECGNGRKPAEYWLVFARVPRLITVHSRKLLGVSLAFLGGTVMPNGTIARLLIDKGFGFIRDEAGVEHFFHRSSVRSTVFELLREGQRVEFTPEDSQKGPRAGDVRLIEG